MDLTSSIWEALRVVPERDGASLDQDGRSNGEKGTGLRYILEWLIECVIQDEDEDKYNSLFLAQVTGKMGVLHMVMSCVGGTGC